MAKVKVKNQKVLNSAKNKLRGSVSYSRMKDGRIIVKKWSRKKTKKALYKSQKEKVRSKLSKKQGVRDFINGSLFGLNNNTIGIKSVEDVNSKKPYYKKDERSFNGLAPTEWASLSKNVWDDVSSPREPYHLEHGATYPIALANRIIKIYSKEGDLIFDPFVGVGTTVVSAYRQKRSGIGIDLNKRFCDIANDILTKEKANLLNDKKSDLFHIIYNDDCRNFKKYFKDNTVQLTFTSPPYANFIQKSLKDREKTHKTSLIRYDNNSTVKQYSQKAEDFGNLDYKNFLKEIKKILIDNLQITKKGGYSVWVVKDCRDTKNKIPYIDFHSDLANIGKEIGWLYQDLIVWDQNKQRRLVLLGYPSVFYSNQNCSFIVVFRKPHI